MNVNRIFCIGKNYADHVAELAHLGQTPATSESKSLQQEMIGSAAQARPAPRLDMAGRDSMSRPADQTPQREDTVAAPDSSCVVFMKPVSSIVPEGQVIALPRGKGSIHHEAELVVMLTGGGPDIPVENALDQIAGVTLGLDLTLRDLQTALKQKGAPWELAKAFDGAAPLGDFKPYLEQDLQALEFTCHVNGALRQHGRTRDMLYSVARQISILSQTWALEPGDIIYTGTPKGVGPLAAGDRVVLESAAIGRFEWHCA